MLASGSTYRKELLQRLNLPFEVAAPDIDESPCPGEDGCALALRLACEKASAIAQRYPDALVIGSDQVAECDGERFGKPGNRTKAHDQLRRLSGRRAVFHTAIALLNSATGVIRTSVVPTRVTFRALDRGEIDRYLDAEPAYDCAGSAKSEGLGICLLDAIEGDDPTALVGLPLIALCRLLRAQGVAIP